MENVWTQHYPPEITESLDYPDILVQDMLLKAYDELSEHTAIRFLGKSVTYGELYHAALRCANGLRGIGVKPGDKVSIMLPSCPQYVISYYGVLLAGGIVVQTNPLHTVHELEHQLNDSQATAMIALDMVYPKVAKVRAKTNLEHIIVTSIKDFLPFPKNILYPLVQRKQGTYVKIPYSETVHSFMTLLQKAQDSPIDLDMSQDDVAVLQYTGGTTGTPKGVMLTHRNLVVNVHQCSAWLYKAEYGKEISLGIVPLFHVYGMTVVMNFSIYMGSTMVLLPKFEVQDAIKAIDKEKPTLFPGAPTIYIALVNAPNIEKYDLSSIKACISGSAPLPREVQERFEKLTNGRLVEGYGLSETSPVTHANPIWGKNLIGSIGLPWPDTKAAILSMETGESVEPGEFGEVAIQGPQVMKGYWNQPEETQAVFRNGWFLTGDIGYMNEEGYFHIVDRKKDMILAGGFNVYPREVEEILYEHEAVQECAVIGVPDPYRGETVKAFIVLKQGAAVTEEELNPFCRQKLASYKVPRIYEFRDELPKSMVGKVLRRLLVEEEKQKQASGNSSSAEKTS